MPYNSRYIYAEGECASDNHVRPHNWAERFAGSMASYSSDRRVRYSNLLEPVASTVPRVCASAAPWKPAILP